MELRKIPLSEAVGTRLGHDITEIRPGEFKGPAFRYGHEVCEADLCRLQRLGKNHLYVLDLGDDDIHENQAACILAAALAGEGVQWEEAPQEGKINLFAGRDGMLKVNTRALAAFNMVDEVMCATLHDHSLVRRGDLVAATRPIPLVLKRGIVERAAAIAGQDGGVVSVSELRRAAAGLVITGSEVYHGLIEDRFAPILRQKIEALGSEVVAVDFVPDDQEAICRAVRGQIERGCDLLLVSGGMSVDPDDVTRRGIQQAGAVERYYGAAVLPGSMFLVAYIGDIPLLGVPACGLYHRATALDLVLPRILAGEHITGTDLALLGHGGLCRNCETCTHPHCAFGKGT